MRKQAFRTIILCLLLGGTFTALAQPSNWQILKFPGPGGLVDRTWCVGMNPPGNQDQAHWVA